MKRLPLALLLGFTLVVTGCGTKTAPATDQQQNNATSGQTTPIDKKDETTKQPSKQYDKAPEMKIDPNKNYEAVVETNKGSFTIQLFAKDAPKTVNNFVFLANDHFYDGIKFHRIIQSFMIQTGDPKGDGTGGPGYSFGDELKNGHSYDKGVVAMANAGPNTNGSQFFVGSGDDVKNLEAQPNYTIFGKITAGMDTIDKIAATPVKANAFGENSTPSETITIQKITVTEK
ncbi:peptidylprolyl isomerase [Brevibacillus laterosporus]|uniref:peptidylprolyl isomerase n=1 Tax=Brevibacillus laterosporus TaxID=1465 RepID=UPI000376EE6A|nr:peptidylprolyl isomerase [Brevibacillus laterosporus]ATO47729.1 peptidylprolyl isomerase [Brevibacillus laterosporus DSM 25]MBG9804805.1 peptidylprolyl isomerase [Brevibacillus laterosporus]MED2002529.1 peptidylprolyl isomerase [Brevibacillus laterosporus]MED4761922.1 peptidylprolyl isomerase [Brevibacillus laterosporus]TPH22981.1 peptidylprolyl isomerase [Brevibacillus laterosporus]